MTAEVYAYLEQSRRKIILIKENEGPANHTSRRWHVIKMPTDINYFDRKIQEILSMG
jgi:hypothetical protein